MSTHDTDGVTSEFDHQNISIKFPCAFPTVISSIFGKSFPFPLFCVAIVKFTSSLNHFLHSQRSQQSADMSQVNVTRFLPF